MGLRFGCFGAVWRGSGGGSGWAGGNTVHRRLRGSARHGGAVRRMAHSVVSCSVLPVGQVL